jgi:hypothetical protein
MITVLITQYMIFCNACPSRYQFIEIDQNLKENVNLVYTAFQQFKLIHSVLHFRKIQLQIICSVMKKVLLYLTLFLNTTLCPVETESHCPRERKEAREWCSEVLTEVLSSPHSF